MHNPVLLYPPVRLSLFPMRRKVFFLTLVGGVCARILSVEGLLIPLFRLVISAALLWLAISVSNPPPPSLIPQFCRVLPLVSLLPAIIGFGCQCHIPSFPSHIGPRPSRLPCAAESRGASGGRPAVPPRHVRPCHTSGGARGAVHSGDPGRTRR